MKRSLRMLFLASLVLTAVARAEVKKGDVMLDFLGGWSQQSFDFPGDAPSGDSTEYFAAIRPGVAVTNHIRVAGVASVAHMEIMGLERTPWALGVSAEYVFLPANPVNPYLGGQIAWVKADLDIPVAEVQVFNTVGAVHVEESGWLLAPRAGLLFTLNPANNLFAEYQYQIWAGDLSDFFDNGHLVAVGIEHKFRVGQ